MLLLPLLFLLQTQDSNVKKVRDIIAKQMFEEGQEALAQVSEGRCNVYTLLMGMEPGKSPKQG